MAKAKFTLNPTPTFKATVEIPRPGTDAGEIEFVFKHRTRDQFKELVDSMADKKDVELVMDVASGWNLADPFDAEHVEMLLQNYFVSGETIVTTYLRELTAGKLGN